MATDQPTLNGSMIPLELMPPGCVPSIYGPLPGTPDTWSSCIHRGSKAYPMGYGGNPRQAVLSALAQVKDDD